MTAFQRSWLGLAKNSGPKQLEFVLRDGELLYGELGEVVYSARKTMRGKR